MSQYSFSAGDLYARPAQTGNTPTTPVRFGALQGVSLDFSFNLKELYGRNQMPLTIARGTGKINGKADWAQLQAAAFNSIFFGGSSASAGAVRAAVAEEKTVTSNAATATYGANFVADMGVVRASDGVPFTRVTSGPGALEYSVNETTGVYAFNSSTNNTVIHLSYTYADPSAVGKKFTISNQVMGAAPSFMLVLTQEYDGKELTLVLNSCQAAKLTMATKLEDFTIPSFDFMASADSSGAIGSISLEE